MALLPEVYSLENHKVGTTLKGLADHRMLEKKMKTHSLRDFSPKFYTGHLRGRYYHIITQYPSGALEEAEAEQLWLHRLHLNDEKREKKRYQCYSLRTNANYANSYHT